MEVSDYSFDWTPSNPSLVDLAVVCIIPHLHDEAGSTSWLDKLARRALVEPARRALDERTTSARRAAS